MKKALPLIIFSFACGMAYSQSALVNLKGGNWKNAQNWLYQRVPSDTDDIVLMQDIVIDTNAKCRSLTTNGFNVTVNNGFHLSITGIDTAAIKDSDTLVTKVTIIYQGMGSMRDTMRTIFRKYTYDNLKRVRDIDETFVSDAEKIRTYYYQGNNQLPYAATFFDKCEYKENNICSQRFDTIYYTYNSSGIVTKEDFVSVRNNFKRRYYRKDDYDFLEDSVFKYSSYNDFSYHWSDPTTPIENFHNDTTRYILHFENGNIVRQYDSSAISYDWHSRKYDKMKNPIFKASIHLPVLPKEIITFEDPEQMNNPLFTQERYSLSGGRNFRRFGRVYKYKPNGYPSEIFLLDYDGTPGTVVILKLEYTK